MGNKLKNIIVYVNSLPPSAVESVRGMEKTQNEAYRIMLMWDTSTKKPDSLTGYDILLECDFSKSWKIAGALLPYQDELLAITCRSESNIARFIKVIPHVPYLRTPSTESLLWATDKYEMRKRLRLFDPKNTPKFTWVKENSVKERVRVAEKVGFPMIIKPANLAGSLFVTICYHEEELEKSLALSFKKLKKAYETNNRIEIPKIIAEEYMEGDMYSIDSYVGTRGKIHHCPTVKVTTGHQVGHDDFYNYLRVTPTVLKRSSVANAQKVVENGIHALGLRNTTVHAELMKVDDEWKIIEIGPRIGGFRHAMYSLSCDIDHSLNDVLVRIPRMPVIAKKCKGFAASMRYYPASEGIVKSLNGIKKIKDLESFHTMTMKLRIGDKVVYAKNGGKGVFDLMLYNDDRSKLLADIRRIEKMVEVKVINTRAKKILPKEIVKKVVKKVGVKKK